MTIIKSTSANTIMLDGLNNDDFAIATTSSDIKETSANDGFVDVDYANGHHLCDVAASTSRTTVNTSERRSPKDLNDVNGEDENKRRCQSREYSPCYDRILLRRRNRAESLNSLTHVQYYRLFIGRRWHCSTLLVMIAVLLTFGTIGNAEVMEEEDGDPLLQLCGRKLTTEVRRICGMTKCRRSAIGAEPSDVVSTTAVPSIAMSGFFKCCISRCRRSRIEAFCCGGDASLVVAPQATAARTYHSHYAALSSPSASAASESSVMVDNTDENKAADGFAPEIVLIAADEDVPATASIRFDLDDDDSAARHRRRRQQQQAASKSKMHHNRSRHAHYHSRRSDAMNDAEIDAALRRYEMSVRGRPESGTLVERIQKFRNQRKLAN